MRIIIPILLFVISNLSSTAQTNSDTISVVKGFSTFYTRNYQLLTTRDLMEITKPNAAAYKEMRIARSHKNFASLMQFSGGFMVGIPLGSALSGGEPNWPIAAIGAGVIIVSIPFSVAYTKHATKAVRIYNEGLKSTGQNSLDFNIGFTQNGLGLQLRF
ncbi:MAG: hypothetical protein ACK4WD_07390 [Flavobacteriales bacterium]|jgi:hypothetical protein